MPTRKEILLTQMRACQNQDGWFAPLNITLRGLTTEQVVKRGEQSGNSIIGIVNHLVFWNEHYLQRFKQGVVSPLGISNAKTFEIIESDEIAEDWNNLRQRLDDLLSQWGEAISNCDEAKLDSTISPKSAESWWSALAHLAIHNAYHIGQIVHMRKEQGLWETWGNIG